jgi:hypothetical protein
MNRQLYDEGGITTLDQAKRMAPPGESLAYINPEEAALLKSLGGAGEDINGTGIKSYFFKKIFRKAKKAVKKVVKSPIGKAALLGGLGYLGATKLGGFSGLGSIVKKSLGGIKNMGLGKQLGLIGGIGSLGGLLASKEAEDEEDEIDINDRGEGMDFDQIQRDIAAYRGGGQDASQMTAKGYRFLTPKRFALAEGGEVNKKISMIKDMLNKGMDDSTISSITGASQEEINIIKTKQRQDKAEGGIMNLGGNEMDLRGGGFVPLGAKEKADDVPARLSKNEFVMTADAVRAAGGGSVDKGADKMYNMMKNLESQV